MAFIKVTVSIIKKQKGCYTARADELAMKSEPASTQRGAIKNLKDAITRRFRGANHDGTLRELLRDAGYDTLWIGFSEPTLHSHTYDTRTAVVRLPRKRHISPNKNRARPRPVKLNR